MNATTAKRFATRMVLRSTYFEVDIHRIGILNVDLFGRRSWKHFKIDMEDGRGGEAFVGPIHVEYAYLPETRAGRGTLAFLAMTAASVAMWTEGHLWHLPFLG